MFPAGDAYDLAASFGDDFSKLLVTGASPFKTMPSPPSMQRVGSIWNWNALKIALRSGSVNGS
jgi:hypothetical protein